MAQDAHATWLENAARLGVSAEAEEIGSRHGVARDSFAVLARCDEITDPDGKSYYLLPRGISAQDARDAVLMTYVLNAGTGYGAGNDFAQTRYGVAECRRIAERQCANRWSYRRDVGFVHRHGGRLVTTPNGMLMGLAGDRLLSLFSQQGGTAWGDIFMVNIASPADPARALRRMVRSGHAWFTSDGQPVESRLALDRVLHHEERHSAQWAAKGYLGMLRDYSWEVIRERVLGQTNRLEQDAGLADGGYRM